MKPGFGSDWWDLAIRGCDRRGPTIVLMLRWTAPPWWFGRRFGARLRVDGLSLTAVLLLAWAMIITPYYMLRRAWPRIKVSP